MDRRGFLRSLIGGVAAASAVRAWPFRVFSFPTDITLPPSPALVSRGIADFDRILKEIYTPAISAQLNRTPYLYLHAKQREAYEILMANGNVIYSGGRRVVPACIEYDWRHGKGAWRKRYHTSLTEEDEARWKEVTDEAK